MVLHGQNLMHKKLFYEGLLVAIVVKVLFTNISNSKGIADAKRRHHNYLKKTLTVKIIITFLALILTAKNFILISKFYQKISCAIGTVCAPALEGIFYNFNSHKLILTSKANQSVIYILLMTFS